MGRRFFTDTGIELPSVTAEQMREVDRLAIEEAGLNLFQMMENAGRSLALFAIEMLGNGWNKANIVVLAGSGGNGGGAICAARHLANRGSNVGLCLAEVARLEEVPTLQRRVYQATRGQEVEAAHLGKKPVDLVLDGLIGYGLRAAPREPVAELIRWANGTGVPIVALDIPSGVDATTGHTPGTFIQPQWTMTLALPKTGLLPQRTGAPFLADIGIPEGLYQRMGLAYVSPFGNRFWVPLTCR